MPLNDPRATLLNRNAAHRNGRWVLYWMQQSQRAEENHALDFAIREGNSRGLPVVVCFGLTDRYPEANRRHYRFMLEGVRETRRKLAEMGIQCVIRRGSPDQVALGLGREAALIVCDRGYLRHQKTWRRQVAQQAGCPVVQVESDVVVPVDLVSEKAEYAARTIRPKIHRRLDDFMRPADRVAARHPSLDLEIEGLDPTDIDAVLELLQIDPAPSPVTPLFRGGTGQAKARFEHFLAHRLERYAAHGNQPQTDDISEMSPYLHFGQISPLWLALQVQGLRDEFPEAAADYLEELIVRRELAINFVHRTPRYDAYAALPEWPRKTLAEHAGDRREHDYSLETLEKGETHDPYWNAAMREMRYTGFMHNYMRMYWGKKVLEWSADPETAFRTLLHLNNRYFLDGRDPNSYAGVAWIFGLHDRAWKERAIFGKVRYMAASGLERKCDIRGYVRKVDSRIRHLESRSEPDGQAP